MRRSVTKFAILATATATLAVATGCEDGPAQTFSAAPTGAGGVWNGPGSTGVPGGTTFVSPTPQSFDASVGGGTNANVLCTASEVHDRRVQFFGAPISPPGLAAGLDIAGGPNNDCRSGYTGPGNPYNYDPAKETWTGCTVEQAEAILCQGLPDSIFYGVTNTVGWGDANEVSVEYNTNNRIITDILLQTGYEGAVSATSVDGKTTYNLALNNKPMTITTASGTTSTILHWDNAHQAELDGIVEGMYDALRNKFSPDTPTDCTDETKVPATCHCIETGHCIVGNNGTGGGYFWYTPLGFIPFVNTTVGTDQANSVFGLIDEERLKLLPFSNSAVTLQFDKAGLGPRSVTTNVAGTGKTCDYSIGMKFSDFDANCVQVFPTNTEMGQKNNVIEQKKLFGGLGHSDEAYIFDVVGVDPNFTATLTDSQVISDTQSPGPDDIAYALNVDQSFLGVLTNDFTNNDATMAQDWHGLGLVTLETAYLVQKYMQAAHGVTTNLGDPACLSNPAAPVQTTPPTVCSGLEGILTSAPPASIVGLPNGASTTMTINAVGPAAITIDGNLGVGLKPGTWYSTFCPDGGGLDAMGNPIGYAACTDNYYFTAMQNAVAASFPPGVPVPADLNDRRFFFQQFILAMVKYLHSAEDPNATLATIDANVADPNDLFFDSNGGGFESGIYVDRANVNSLGQAPTALTIGTNLTTSVLNNMDFQRYNFRGEKLLYNVMTTKPGDKPGAEGQLITNLVGSPVLVNTFGSYECATNTDPTNMDCGGALAPTDAFGTPLYMAYQGAFGQSFLTIAPYGYSATPSPMTVNAAGFELIQSAQITVPVWSNPFDPSTATPNDKTFTALLPYFPPGANIGFPVTIDGSRDKFYNTSNVDLTGTTVNANVDFEYVAIAGAGADGGPGTELVIRAVETQNYLGQVFACAEPNPSGSGAIDILAVRMYDNATEILDFISSHPNATVDCGFVVKYSPYGNYADYITSQINGIRFGLNPGFGGSVVSDVTLFDPNVVAALGS